MSLIDRGQVMSDYLENLGRADSYKAKYEALVKAIDDAPTIDAEPVRHGRWVGYKGEFVGWDEDNPGCPRHSCFCSVCKEWLTASDEYPVIAYYCPNCGAKMDSEVEHD